MTMNWLITAGPTREPIDAVRFISNRSSGRVGVALVEAALAAGDVVTLLLGPVDAAVIEPLRAWISPQGDLPSPSPSQREGRLSVHRFETTDELQRLLETHFSSCDVLVMAAAVADYRVAKVNPGKLPRKQHVDEQLTLALTPTPDLVAQFAACKQIHQRIVAFALEQPEQLEARALEKMQRKGVDAIVANPLNTMDAADIEPLWLTATGQREQPGTLQKNDFAQWLMQRIRSSMQ